MSEETVTAQCQAAADRLSAGRSQEIARLQRDGLEFEMILDVLVHDVAVATLALESTFAAHGIDVGMVRQLIDESIGSLRAAGPRTLSVIENGAVDKKAVMAQGGRA